MDLHPNQPVSSLSAADAVDTTTCFRCHYDLRGVADDQPCPECGLLAIRSRRPTDALRDARPKWLRSLSIGVWLILLALLGTVVLSGYAPIVTNLLYTDWQQLRADLKTKLGIDDSILFTFISYSGLIFGATLLFLGVLMLTRPEGYEPADRADRGRRFILRAFSIAPLVLVAVFMSFSLLSSVNVYRSDNDVPAWKVILYGVLALICVPIPLLGFAQFRSLANRAGSAHLAEHCQIVGTGLAATIALAHGVCLVVFRPDWFGIGPMWFSRSPAWVGMMLTVVTAVMLFWLWSLYLMIRFAISFGRASVHARHAWRMADRSHAG